MALKESKDRFEIKTPEYTYVGYVDYERTAGQAARYFREYVRTGADLDRGRFVVSLDMLIEGKNRLKQEVNLGYLMKDSEYAGIRAAFKARKPDGDVDEFLDAIIAVKNGNEGAVMEYGEEFADAVLKCAKKAKR